MPQAPTSKHPQPHPQQQRPSPQPQGAPPAQQPKAAPHDDKSKHDDHGRDHDKDKGKDDKEKSKAEANEKAEANKEDAPQSTRAHDDAVNNPMPADPPPPGVAPPEYDLPIGARPHDKRDPQSAKFEAHAAPPFWHAPKADQELQPREEWTPDPALDPREQKPPQGYYADGMSAPDEQRARAAWVEAHGLREYDEATDQRPRDEQPTFDPHALAGGGAFVSAGKQRQVPGVVPPTKRE